MKRKSIILLVSVIVLFSMFIFFSRPEKEYIPNEYEKELISYFKEISLQSEYDDNPEKIIKWKKQMNLFIFKEEEFKKQMSVINKTINEINKLATDGFKIVLTDNPSKSNSILFLCKKEKVAQINPNFYKILNDDIDYEISGLAYSEFNSTTYTISKSLIFINSEEPIDKQEVTILEEITQSLGLAFDSEKYSSSIFYKNKPGLEILPKGYSMMDKDVVRLLYHSKMKTGLNSIELERVIKKILKSEKD